MRWKFWKRGSGEALAFICIMPFVLLMIIAILSAVKIALKCQDLDACAYNACRAAVVSGSYEDAKANADQIYAASVGTQNSLQYGYEPCTLTIVDGGLWSKGAYIRCTVRYYIETEMPFTSGIRERSIVMMIENYGTS